MENIKYQKHEIYKYVKCDQCNKYYDPDFIPYDSSQKSHYCNISSEPITLSYIDRIKYLLVKRNMYFSTRTDIDVHKYENNPLFTYNINYKGRRICKVCHSGCTGWNGINKKCHCGCIKVKWKGVPISILLDPENCHYLDVYDLLDCNLKLKFENEKYDEPTILNRMKDLSFGQIRNSKTSLFDTYGFDYVILQN